MENDKEKLRRLNRENRIAAGTPVNMEGKRIKVEKSDFHKALEARVRKSK